MENLPGAKYATAAAFSEVVALYGKDMFRVALYILGGNASEAEDAYQEALIGAFQGIGSFRGETTLKGWLLTIVRNACLCGRRGRKNDRSLHVRIDTVEQSIEEPTLVSPDVPADITAMNNEDVDRLQEILGAVRPSDRELLIRHHLNEEELRKIAQSMGMTVPAIKTRLFRAREAARERGLHLLDQPRERRTGRLVLAVSTLPAMSDGLPMENNPSVQLAGKPSPRRYPYRRKSRARRPEPSYLDQMVRQYCRQFIPLIVFRQHGRQCIQRGVNKVLREFTA